MKKLKLKEVSDIYGGYAFKSKDFGVGENFVVKIKDIKPPIIDVENADKVDVSKYSTQKLEKFKVFPDDIVIAMTGATIGKVGRNKSGRTVFLNQRVSKINPNFKEDLDFIYYCINNTVFLEYVLNNVDSKSAQANISHFGIGNFEINWYDRETRQKIAKVLTCLDDKIFINSQINQELEAMAKTLYDYWFVQFDFPDQNGNPYKSSGGKMVYHPGLKREIPEGWGVEKLKYFLTIKNGKDHKHLQDGKFAVDGSGGIMRTVANYLYSGESILFPRKGTLNNVMYINEKFWTVDTMFYSEVNKNNSALYVFYSVKDIDFNKLNTGTGVPSMTSSILYDLNIIVPEENILEKFNTIVKQNYETIKLNSIQNQELTQLRDWLLPMLMNGQVKVE